MSGAGGALAAGTIANLHVTVPLPERSGRPVWLPPRPAALAGRDDLLAHVHDRLTGGEGSWPRVVALHGVGGAGKTSVAVEYAHRHLADVSVAWLLRAEDRTGLEAEFGRLAPLLGASGGLLDPRDPVASVLRVLADSSLPWLLIFDNVPDQAAVREFLPPTGPGQVLITSQSPAWPPGEGTEVRPLEVAVAAGFLVNRTGDADAGAARELAGDLGGLPLALEHAAAYSDAAGIPLAAYLDLFRQRRAEVMARGTAAGHPASVAATLGLALSRLEAGAPAAAGLLRLLACLAPEPVPLSRLPSAADLAAELDPAVSGVLGPLLGDPLAMADAITALRLYSLITPAAGGTVLVHRLVQAVTVDQMPAESARAWRATATLLIEAAVPSDAMLPTAWPACAVLLPHARAVLDLTSSGIWRIALYLGAAGSYPAARDLFELIADAHERSETHGPEHRDTLAARNQFARCTGQAGDAAAAQDQLAALLPATRKVLGTEHPDTLTDRSNLAYWIKQTDGLTG